MRSSRRKRSRPKSKRVEDAHGVGGVAEDSSRKKHKSDNLEDSLSAVSPVAVPPVTLPTLPSVVPAPPSDHTSHVAAILHEHTGSKIAQSIAHARQSRPGDGSTRRPDEMKCHCIGELLLGLGGPLDVCRVLEGGGAELQLALLLHVVGNEGHWLLRVGVPGREEHLEVKMDDRLAKWEAAEVAKIVSRTTVQCLRLFLKECGRGSGCVMSKQLCVEVWALGPIWHVGVASECGVKLTNRTFYVSMVTMMYGITDHEPEGKAFSACGFCRTGGGVW